MSWLSQALDEAGLTSDVLATMAAQAVLAEVVTLASQVSEERLSAICAEVIAQIDAKVEEGESKMRAVLEVCVDEVLELGTSFVRGVVEFLYAAVKKLLGMSSNTATADSAA